MLNPCRSCKARWDGGPGCRTCGERRQYERERQEQKAENKRRRDIAALLQK